MNRTLAEKIIRRYKKIRKEIVALENRMWKGSIGAEFRGPLMKKKNALIDEQNKMKIEYRKAIKFLLGNRYNTLIN